MKALRYLLIAFAAMIVMSVNAQSLAQQPSTQFQSTSSLVGSGSTLPQAVQTGAYTTYDMNEIAKDKWGSIRREDGDGDGFEDDEDPDNPGEPFPIGDAAWPLALCALAFALFRYVRQRTRA